MAETSPSNGWELSAWLNEELPRTMYYELLLDGNAPGNLSRRLLVYDLATGDMLTAAVGATLVREGVAQEITVEGGRIRAVPTDGDAVQAGGPPRNGRELPILYAVWLIENPELVTSVEAHRDDSLSVQVKYPRERWGEPEFVFAFELDADGVVTRAWDPEVSTSSRRPEVFRYDNDYPRRWMVLSDDYLSWNWDVERRVVQETTPLDAFTDATLARLIVEADTDYRSWSHADVNEKRVADGLDPVPLDAAVSKAIQKIKGRSHPWRWPLVAGGMLALGLAFGVWWHRRTV